MRKSFVVLLLCIATLTSLTHALVDDEGATTANFDPQIPTADRSRDDRVFLERANVLYKTESDTFTVVAGDVMFTKGPMTMYCDSAHYDIATESFDAFGSVHMEQGDTLFVFADRLEYEGELEIAHLYADPGNKVRLINRDVSLETDIFVYDLRNDIGYYEVGGVLLDKENRLESLQGEYVPSTKEANFYVDVHLTSLAKNDTLDIYTDTLYYNTDTHIAELFSPSQVVNSRGTIYTRSGLYDTQVDTAALYMRSHIVSPPGRHMEADTIYYDRRAGRGRCYGNMVLTDSIRSSSISAHYGFFNQLTDSVYATGRLLVKEYSQGDTLYLHGRQINSFRQFDTIHIKAIPADTLLGTPEVPATTRIDTNNIADIYPRVRLYRSDLQGVCDSMRMTRSDTTLRMYVNPVLWSGERQIYGNVIEIEMNDSTVDRVRLPQSAFSSQRVVDIYYNQMSGKEMIAYFKNGELSRLDINGNVELMMYPEEADSTINKMVTAQSSFLTARFKDQNAEYVKMWPETTGKTTPLFLARRSMLYLAKFRIFEGIRPLSPADVFIIPEAMDEIMNTAERPSALAPKR